MSTQLLCVGPERPSYLFGRWKRHVIRWIAVLLLLSSMFFLLCFAAVYLLVPADQARVVGVWAPLLNAGVSFVLAGLHLCGILSACCGGGGAHASIAPETPDASVEGRGCTACVRRMYTTHFSRFGTFGLLGPQYEAKLMLKQVVQIPAQLYQAYRMSWLLTDATASLAYALVLVCNCIALPLLLASGNPFTRRWVAAFLDAILTFLLSSGIPLILNFRAIATYYFAKDASILDNHAWLNATILLARFVVVSSPLDFVTKVVPFFTCYLSLRSMTHAGRVRLTPAGRQKLLLNKVLSRRWRYLYSFVSVGTGIGLLGIAAAAVQARHCPHGCLLQTYPWLATECTCVMLRVNCATTPLVTDLETYLAPMLPDLFDLEVEQCDLPSALSARALSRMRNLYSITLQRTNTVRWDVSPDALPRTLFAIFLCHLYLPAVPMVLQRLSGNVHYVFLRNVSLYANASLPAAFTTLVMLEVSNASLVQMPLVLAPQMTYLNFQNNAILDLPTNLPAVGFINFVNNSIAQIPLSLAESIGPYQTLHLEGNPIASLPPEFNVDVLRTGRLVLRETPLCDRLGARRDATGLSPLERQIFEARDAICPPQCSVGCYESLLGNTNCNMECLTPSCNNDDGDCDRFIL
ncbi:hypothetical protein SDRG_00094 [Saprolegnia diclina VS20]|uniref:LNR domain-containing protein n=1 Tax=Saprolegnia diclina (strain VS20) TaxID=1156394 RepID=T0R5Y7_SAPDV|nr:hypothetical protein SDRG_00094 [Saprolegnia diclina VS20]EQC42356.1 hypothetical protein SDRG_00094 [Saprolegnia diclina VS20]|eukprot:XP_008603779.1 hypothetical protein SDRG_00094 [Saprolegnia diclina VS20]